MTHWQLQYLYVIHVNKEQRIKLNYNKVCALNERRHGSLHCLHTTIQEVIRLTNILKGKCHTQWNSLNQPIDMVTATTDLQHKHNSGMVTIYINKKQRKKR